MKIAILILSLLLVYSATSQTIRISRDHIFINKSKFDSTNLLSDYLKILGPPSRIIYATNISSHNNYVFDSIGIAILENNSKKITEIRINLLERKDWDFLPSHMFKGKILLNQYNYHITENSSYHVLQEVCKENKNDSFKFDADDESSDFQYGGYFISFDHILKNEKTATVYIDFNFKR
ncbi:MAG: hypothetical protein KAY50_08375 [Chitinophagaceae bacterium]|nr:hypothetical protein [Chitinophagaceae bacterium]